MRKFSGFLRLIAFGDALGAPYEESDDSVLNRWKEGRRRPIPDADALSNKKLVWTDDTAMNLAVGRAMASAGGYSAESAWAEYKKALGDERVHGWGRVVKAAIEQGSGVKDTARNGALMRAPMVLMSCLLGDWNSALERALENIVKDTRLTHNSDLCVAASVSYSRALFAAISAPDYDDKPGSIANVLDEVIVSVDLDLEEMAIDPRARLAVVTTMEDVRRWIRSSPRVVLEEIKSSSYLPSGHVLSTLATSVWLGLYAMMACSFDVPLEESLHLGIEMGGDVDTRLALAAPFSYNFFGLQRLMPDFSRVDRIEEVIEVERLLDEARCIPGTVSL